MSQDRPLVEAVTHGDTDAFRHLYEHHAPALCNFIARRTPSREVAEDLVQDCFIRVWKARERLNPAQSFKAYLYRIARNRVIDWYRSRHPDTNELSGLELADAVDPHRFAVQDRIAKALANLSSQQRQVFCMSRFDALTYRDIAAVLDISVKTVEVHMGHALKRLRSALQDLAQLLFLPWWW